MQKTQQHSCTDGLHLLSVDRFERTRRGSPLYTMAWGFPYKQIVFLTCIIAVASVQFTQVVNDKINQASHAIEQEFFCLFLVPTNKGTSLCSLSYQSSTKRRTNMQANIPAVVLIGYLSSSYFENYDLDSHLFIIFRGCSYFKCPVHNLKKFIVKGC